MYKFKTIYISYDGMTDPLGQSQVIPYLLGLSNHNIEIHLISFEKAEKYSLKQHDIENLFVDSNIIWHPLKYHQKPPVISTLLDIWHLHKKVNEILIKNSISLVHCRSYISALVGRSLKKNKGIPFIFDMRGFWADERVDGYIWNLKNPLFKSIYNFFKAKEKQFIIQSDKIISLTNNAKNEILNWQLKGINNSKIQVIPCCADLNHFSLYAINAVQLKSWQKMLAIADEDFVVSYVGSLGTWYMIDEMMEMFQALCAKIPKSKFLIVTADEPEIAYNAAKKLNIPKALIVVKKAERSEVPYLIALSKFSIFFIKPSYSKKASSPTKLAEILGMGVPVICNSNVGDVQSIVEEGNVGVVINEFNKAQYEIAIERMIALLPADNISIANYAKKYASLEDGINKYLKIYTDIFNTKSDDRTPL
jgi:glycosyltransferase involved in cell wall biosynthesis